ncbi:unnamed protein product [Rangifer tarandus platyrhynchus]|uniref:Uncharacterized protein n=3 Tax=Rangifer tarandus platyrhynchus TaxID=3082113 RepID=A0ACB0EI87_RANTA|nr:unnamed protein product [Rangifer tarandus platyrhynchus]CAI9700204.1 unnamed protein product [Rangifer tarandus platyrhynchus]
MLGAGGPHSPERVCSASSAPPCGLELRKRMDLTSGSDWPLQKQGAKFIVTGRAYVPYHWWDGRVIGGGPAVLEDEVRPGRSRLQRSSRPPRSAREDPAGGGGDGGGEGGPQVLHHWSQQTTGAPPPQKSKNHVCWPGVFPTAK